jgi:hypothetical protein
LTGLDEDLARDGAGDLLYKLLELRRAVRAFTGGKGWKEQCAAWRRVIDLVPGAAYRDLPPEGGAP